MAISYLNSKPAVLHETSGVKLACIPVELPRSKSVCPQCVLPKAKANVARRSVVVIDFQGARRPGCTILLHASLASGDSTAERRATMENPQAPRPVGTHPPPSLTDQWGRHRGDTHRVTVGTVTVVSAHCSRSVSFHLLMSPWSKSVCPQSVCRPLEHGNEHRRLGPRCSVSDRDVGRFALLWMRSAWHSLPIEFLRPNNLHARLKEYSCQ